MHFINIQAANSMQRLAWPLIISLILHIALLSQGNWKGLPISTSYQHRLTVSIAPYYSAHTGKTLQINQSHHDRADATISKKQAGEKGNEEMITSTSAKIDISNAGETNGTAGHLDLNQLLDQAKVYATKEYHTSIPEFTLDGDYYGTYTGSDNGTFFIHLDNAGHASGSGQSSMRNINFLITGDVTKDGFIQMSGKGIAGKARFEGQLKISTGTISGSWLAPGGGSGAFSGQHE